MHHSKYSYVRTVVESGMPVLLESEAGAGKSTLARQLASDLGLTFHSMSCTKQMSVNALLGFISINGVYIPTQLRTAFENGGLFLLDEIDAADPNVLLCLNTIENGFISFPDGIVQMHPQFRLIATANPAGEHSTYTGRSKLDFSTLNRYFRIHLDRDPNLELSLTSTEIVQNVEYIRTLFREQGITKPITMRDTIRMYKLSQLGITDCVYTDVVLSEHPSLHEDFTRYQQQQSAEARKASMTQTDATTVDELWEAIQRESKSSNADNELKRQVVLDIINKYYNTPTATLPQGYSITKNPTEFSYEYTVKVPSGEVYTFDEKETNIIPF